MATGIHNEASLQAIEFRVQNSDYKFLLILGAMNIYFK